MNDENTVESQVNEAPEETVNDTEQETEVAEPTVADLHEVKPTKTEKPKLVPFARLDKEIAKRKELEAKLAEYELAVEDGDEEAEPEVRKLAQKLELIEKRDQDAQFNSRFQEHLGQALENNPEYKGVVNAEVIKSLVLNPANANKTYKQLLEEAYGNAITGRRTVENTTHRGGAKDSKVDMKRAQSDSAYRHEVLADPDLRKQYNEGITDRIFR
jgi:hypothetical protein